MPRSRRSARLAEAGLHAGQVLQLEHHVFQDVAGPGAFAQALQEAAALADAAAVLDQAGQQRGQALVKPGISVRRGIFERADIEPGFDHRAIGPDIGAAQVVDAQQLDVCLDSVLDG